ncbi:MAG: CHAT domain-containing protein [Actinomycetales bacterium]
MTGLPEAYLGRVLTAAAEPVGTCWVAAPGVVVTAYHVVQDVTGSLPVVWQDDAATPDPGSVVPIEPLRAGVAAVSQARVLAVDAVLDVAILSGGWACATPVLAATDLVRPDEPAQAVGAGYLDDPTEERARRVWSTTGRWMGLTMFEDSTRLGVLVASGVLKGLSGGPVVRLSDGQIIGMVSGRYNSADGWARDSVWLVRVEDVVETAGESCGGGLDVRGRVELAEPADVIIRVDAHSLSLRCPQLGLDATTPHDGFTHRMASLLGDVHRVRASHAEARHDDSAVGRSVAAGTRMRELSAHLSTAFLAGEVGAALATVFAEATRVTMPVRLGFDVREEALRRLPWEALVVPGTPTPVALHPLATVYRAAPDGATGRSVSGPLTIVVAIASPIDGNGALLDYETELRNVITAVKGARGGDARIRVVPFATLAAIRSYLDSGDVHVLHISGHGSPGRLVLEGDDGKAVFVTAREFVDGAVPPGKMPPMVSLAACYTNVPGEGADSPVAAFADGLVAAGVPVVVGTETSVTDRYATRVFAQVYADLARAVIPSPVEAVGSARRAVQESFASVASPRDEAIAALDEWAVVTVQASNPAASLFDTSLPSLPDLRLRNPGAERVGNLLALDPGQFVGRRPDQHRLARVMLGDQDAGAMLTGIGGIGKTTLATEVVRRVRELLPEMLEVTVERETHPDGVLLAITSALRSRYAAAGKVDQIAPLLQFLEDGRQPWQSRLPLLQQHVFRHFDLVVVLDNFEDNLVRGDTGYSVRDTELAAFLASWLSSPGRARLLITSRHPVELPEGAQKLLLAHRVGPLTFAETMKLAWALPRLDALTDDELRQVWAGVGGHPRTLETVDALLAGGRGRLPHIRTRLEKRLTETLSGSDQAARWLDRERDLDAAMADAVTLAADDVLLPELLSDLSGEARRLLAGLAVFRRPVDDNAVLFAVGEPDEAAAFVPDRGAAAKRIEAVLIGSGAQPNEGGDLDLDALDATSREELLAAIAEYRALPRPPRSVMTDPSAALEELVMSSLLARTSVEDGDRWFVHRWTASELDRLAAAVVAGSEGAGNSEDIHVRAADYFLWRVAVWPQDRDADIADVLEARHHHEAARYLDEANSDTEHAASAMHERGHWDAEAALISDQLNRLPDEHDRRASWYHQLGILAQARGDYDTAEQRITDAYGLFVRVGAMRNAATAARVLAELAQERGSGPVNAIGWWAAAIAASSAVSDGEGLAGALDRLDELTQGLPESEVVAAAGERVAEPCRLIELLNWWRARAEPGAAPDESQ